MVAALKGEEPALVLFVQVPQIIQTHATLLFSFPQHHSLVASIRASSKVDESIRDETRETGDDRVEPGVVDADLHLVHPVRFMNGSHKHLGDSIETRKWKLRGSFVRHLPSCR